jgi:hypothetical protein
MVLEGNRKGVVAPVVEIVRELHHESYISRLIRGKEQEDLLSTFLSIALRHHSEQD